MVSYKQKSSAVLYSLFSSEDSELKLKLELKLELELPLLLVLGVTRAGIYQTSVDHKGDTWIATDLGKHNTEQLLLHYSHGADHTHQLNDCFDQIEGSEAY